MKRDSIPAYSLAPRWDRSAVLPYLTILISELSPGILGVKVWSLDEGLVQS